MLTQVSVSLEGGDETDTIEVYVDTNEVEPTLESTQINGLNYYQAQVPIAPIGGGNLEYVIAKIPFNPTAPIYIEDEEVFNKFQATNQAMEEANTVDWVPVYEVMASPQRFPDMDIRILGGTTADQFFLGPDEFEVIEEDDAEDGLGHAWQVRAGITRVKADAPGSQGVLASVIGTFYIHSVDGVWDSYVEFYLDDIEDAEEEAEEEAEQETQEAQQEADTPDESQANTEGNSQASAQPLISNEDYQQLVGNLSAISAATPGMYIGSVAGEFRTDLIPDWVTPATSLEAVNEADERGWMFRMSVWQGSTQFPNSQVAALWDGAGYDVVLKDQAPAPLVEATNGEAAGALPDNGIDPDGWLVNADFISKATIFIHPGWMGEDPVGERNDLALQDNELADEVLPSESVPPGGSAWMVRARVGPKDGEGDEESIFTVSGTYCAVYENDAWRTYFVVDPDDPANADAAGKLTVSESN